MNTDTLRTSFAGVAGFLGTIKLADINLVVSIAVGLVTGAYITFKLLCDVVDRIKRK